VEHLIVHLLNQYGYVIVALLVFAEGVGVPLPGETALITAAAFAAHHELSLPWVIVSAAIGAAAGGTGGYWIGRSGGLAFLQRHGRLFRLSEQRLERARRRFQQHGAKAVFIARFVALLRMLAGIMAGVSRMPFGTFTVANVAGAICWSVVFGVLGFIFGDRLPVLEHYIGRTSIVLLLALVLATLVVLHRRRMRAVEES
jgi:membrane protein DedA with SNARE-associated domain